MPEEEEEVAVVVGVDNVACRLFAVEFCAIVASEDDSVVKLSALMAVVVLLDAAAALDDDDDAGKRARNVGLR